MKKILCKLGMHKKGKLISEWMANVWGEGWDLWECRRCKAWYSVFVPSYFDKALYEGTEAFLRNLKP